jgi:hypothetical protein
MTSQYGTYALRAGLERLHALMSMHTHVHAPARVSTSTHAHTQRPISNIYCFSTATMICERASLLPYKLRTLSVLFSDAWPVFLLLAHVTLFHQSRFRLSVT